MSTHAAPAQPVSRDRLAGAFVLVAVGTAIATAQAVPALGGYLIGTIAAILLATFVLTREYGMAVAAGILGGFAAGIAIVTNGNESVIAGGGFMISLAAGFLSVYVLGRFSRPVERHPWPLVPAATFSVIGVAALVERPEIATVATFLAAAGLVLAGLRTLVRRETPERS